MQLTVSVLAALILFSMPLQGASATEETVTVEEEFNIEIPDEEAEKIKYVKDAISYVNARL